MSFLLDQVCLESINYVYTYTISDEVTHVSTTDIPRHLGGMVELLCEEDSQKDTQDPGTMVGGGLMLGNQESEGRVLYTIEQLYMQPRKFMFCSQKPILFFYVKFNVNLR